MDCLVEEKFIRNYVIKSKQDRLLYELCNSKLRDKCISRFANPEDVVNLDRILISSKDIKIDEIELNLRKYMENDKCYNISKNQLDGVYSTLSDSLRFSMDSYMTSIIICSDNVVFIKTETEFGSPNKYILLNET